MGKASRRKKIVDPAKRSNWRAPIPFVERPFEGLAAECQLVAMREIIPSATMAAKTTVDRGGVDFDFVTLLPDGVSAMVRGDGRILVGLQTRFSSGDLSHDAGGALVAALAKKEAGETGIVTVDVRDPAPRLQELLDDSVDAVMALQEHFGFWIDPTEEVTSEIEQALEQSREETIPTEVVPGCDGMYWCAMNRNFVRYVSSIDESQLFTALARLQADGRARIGKGSRFVGAFRACGLAIPVFELGEGVSAEDIAGDAATFIKELDKALKIKDPLTHDERRARDGLVSRQVTIR